MRIQLPSLVATVSLAATTFFTVGAQAHNVAHVCKKAGAEVKTAGADEKAQEADCVKQGGTWEKHMHDAMHTEKHDDKKQSAGGGGGW
jgi:hypothetical protein